MFITEIECSNYRSFGEKAAVCFKRGYNTIVGENNAGKTNLLRAIEIMTGRLRENTNTMGEEYETDENYQVIKKLPRGQMEITDNEYHNNNKNLKMTFRLRFHIDKEDAPRLEKISEHLAKTSDYQTRTRLEVIVKQIESIDIVEILFEVVYEKDDAFSGRPTTINEAYLRIRKKFDKDIQQDRNSQEMNFNIKRSIESEFAYDEFIEIFNETILTFPEFRTKPQAVKTSSKKTSTSGSELSNVLFNLKNSGSTRDQSKYAEIVTQFSEFTKLKIKTSVGPEGPILQFVDGNFDINIDGIGAGLIELLNFLTHLVTENDKIFIIDEPELHLHPQGKRILLSLLKEGANNNQIIFTTHSQDFLSFEEIEKITLIRKFNGESKIYRYTNKIDDFMKNTLKRLVSCEQKEFLFAKRILLVEGQTEYGAMPVFANKLGYNFDKNSVSVTPACGNYFVGFIKIFSEFELPFIALFDGDVLTNITTSIQSINGKIKTCPLIEQLDQLGLIEDKDRDLIKRWEHKIISKEKNSKKISIPQSLLKKRNICPELDEFLCNIDNDLRVRTKEEYQIDLLDDIRDFVKDKIKGKYQIEFLEPTFEQFFIDKDFNENMKKARSEFKFKDSKVLLGRYLAESIELDKIPNEIIQVIDKLKSIG